MTTVIRRSGVPPVAEPANHLTLQVLVTAAAHGPDVSLARVLIDGQHRRLRTDRSTRVYTVLDGELSVQVADGVAEVLGPGDVAVIPRGAAYVVAGTATYLVINAPAFVDGDDVYEEQP